MGIMAKFCAILMLSVSMYGSLAVSLKAKSTWDHFVFALQWPMSVCDDRNLTHHYNCAIPDVVSTWTVHGLWPSNGASKGPEACNTSAKFDPDQLNSIQNDLQRYWPNLYTDSSPTDFWKHEWDKHGTCAMSLPELDSELKYFSKGIELAGTYNISSILNQAGITPDDGQLYQYSDFLSAVSNGLKQTPVLRCFHDKKTKTQFIIEIEFCIDKTFQLMDCPTDNTLRFKARAAEEYHCRSDESLAYPAIKH